MNELRTELEPMLELLRYHVPAEWISNAMTVAVVAGLLGLVMASSGVRIVRGVLVLAFTGGGVWAGMATNQWLGLGPWFCAICGALVFGSLGLVLYRLWVGVGLATLLTCVALSVLGHQQARPHWGEFREARLSDMILPDGGAFTPPTVEQQEQFNSPDPAQIFHEFGDHLAQNVPNIKRNTLLICGITALGGLLLGLLAVRFTMVLGSALVGVALLGSCAGYFLTRYQPQIMDRAAEKPVAVLAGVGIAVLLSMGVQWFQTGRAGKNAGSAAAKPGAS